MSEASTPQEREQRHAQILADLRKTTIALMEEWLLGDESAQPRGFKLTITPRTRFIADEVQPGHPHANADEHAMEGYLVEAQKKGTFGKVTYAPPQLAAALTQAFKAGDVQTHDHDMTLKKSGVWISNHMVEHLGMRTIQEHHNREKAEEKSLRRLHQNPLPEAVQTKEDHLSNAEYLFRTEFFAALETKQAKAQTPGH